MKPKLSLSNQKASSLDNDSQGSFHSLSSSSLEICKSPLPRGKIKQKSLKESTSFSASQSSPQVRICDNTREKGEKIIEFTHRNKVHRVPKSIGKRFEIEGPKSQGGFATVFKAIDQ